MGTPRNIGLSVIYFALFLVIWQFGVQLFEIPAFILPTPTTILVALFRGIESGVYVEHLWVTLLETALGFAVGSTLAFVFGIAVALNRRLEFFLYPYIIMFQSMPKVALAPLIVVGVGRMNAGIWKIWTPNCQMTRKIAK